MQINPKSLTNLKPGANSKDAVRVTLTLRPVTVALLKAQGNMSEAVDKLIQLCILGKVQHDGCLNPIVGTGTENPKSQDVHSSIEATVPTGQCAKPAYYTQAFTRKEMIERGLSAYKLDKMPYGTALRDGYGQMWWKEAIDKGNDNLRPLGSRANTLWCR